MIKKGNLIVLSLLVALSCAASVTASFAWFTKGTGADISFGNTTDNYLTGAAEKNLFASGTGDADDPYIIKTPVQLYNLAWAYYSGMYDDDYPYFKLDPSSGTLNMSGYTLPPIGTEDHPFIASFDGNNKTIENLTVSNVFSDYGTAHPTTIKTGNTEITLNSSTFNPPKVVGFFGAVGPIVTNTHYSDYTGITAALTNLTLNNLSVKSETSQTLVGLAAGYVDGNMSGVKVGGNSTIDLGTSAKNFFSQDITENLSDYSLVGYSTKNNATEYYAQEVSNYYHWGAGDDPGWGGSVDMRNMFNRLTSIGNSATTNTNYAYVKDMVTRPNQTTYERDVTTGYAYTYRSQTKGSFVFSDTDDTGGGGATSRYLYLSGGTKYHQIKQTETTTTGYTIYYNNHYLGVSGTTIADHQDGWRIANNHITILINGSLYFLTHNLTLSMTQKDEWTRSSGRIYYTSSYYGYTTYYNYITYSGNRWSVSTAYRERDITSLTLTSTTITTYDESSNGDDYMDYSGTNVTYFPLMTDDNYDVVEKNTGYVLSGSEDTTTSGTYPNKTGDIRVSRYSTNDIRSSYQNNTLSTVYTVDESLKTTTINSNNYTKFTSSAAEFLPVLTGGGGNIYGLHFMSANISTSHLVNVSSALINGEEKTNYKMPSSCIDFHLAKKGVINFFAGTYFSGNNSFFSLHHIERNGDSISAIKEIDEIYQSNNKRKNYIYKYIDGSYSNTLTDDYSMVFSTQRIKKAKSNSGWKSNAVYYFEIPVNSGEYALGSVSGGTGAYLMYLDIGANASAVDSITASYVKTLTAGAKFPIGVDFATTDLTGTSGGETLGVVLSTTSSNSTGNTASFEVNGTAITFLSTYPSTSTLHYAFNVKKVEAGSTSLGDPDYDNIIVTKLTTLNIVSRDESVWTIVLIETYDTFEATEPTSSGYYSIVCDGVGMSEENLPGEFNTERVDTIKAYLKTIIKIIRDTGINTFDAQTLYLPTTTDDGTVYNIANITIDDTGIALLFEDVDETFTITVVNADSEELYTHTGTTTTNP